MKAAILKAVREAMAAKNPCAVVTALDGSGQSLVEAANITGDLSLSAAAMEETRRRISQDRSGILDGGKIFARVYGPHPRMVIVGAVHIAQFLAPIAGLAGFDVTVIDPREAFVRSSELSNISSIVAWPDEAIQNMSLDARTAVVTLTHDPKLDDPALDAALRSPAFYIGALGSKKTHAKRLERLAAAGFSHDDQLRVCGPIGLDINAVTPAEIAVAIVAQVIGALRAGSRVR